MAAYVIFDIKVTDTDRFAQYRELAPGPIAAYGGRYVVRGGATEVLEGQWKPNRLVVLEFPSVDRAKEWLESPEYRPARDLRRAATITNAVLSRARKAARRTLSSRRAACDAASGAGHYCSPSRLTS
jgi:uncharacterized protein (DUF1330 family)